MSGLVQEILDAGVPSDDFYEALESIGVDAARINGADHHAFVVKERLTLPVDEETPRITRSTFRWSGAGRRDGHPVPCSIVNERLVAGPGRLDSGRQEPHGGRAGMTTLERYSERYGATGALAGVGILNQLGRPNVESLELLVREAVQNCWDARIRERITVEIGRMTLRGSGQGDPLPVSPPPKLPLRQSLVAPSLPILWFADFGTHGLRGPVRADAPGEYRDYIDFVLNVGSLRTRSRAAERSATEAAFYRASLGTYHPHRHAVPVGKPTARTTSHRMRAGRELYLSQGEAFHRPALVGTCHCAWPRSVDRFGRCLCRRGSRSAPSAGRKRAGTTIAILDPGIYMEEDGADPTTPFLAEAVSDSLAAHDRHPWRTRAHYTIPARR